MFTFPFPGEGDQRQLAVGKLLPILITSTGCSNTTSEEMTTHRFPHLRDMVQGSGPLPCSQPRRIYEGCRGGALRGAPMAGAAPFAGTARGGSGGVSSESGVWDMGVRKDLWTGLVPVR